MVSSAPNTTSAVTGSAAAGRRRGRATGLAYRRSPRRFNGRGRACYAAPMAEAPWIIDTWVNLLPPVAEHQREAAENVFGRYGQLDVLREGTTPEALLAEMDAADVAVGGAPSTHLHWT